jgi:hypothetical protein
MNMNPICTNVCFLLRRNKDEALTANFISVRLELNGPVTPPDQWLFPLCAWIRFEIILVQTKWLPSGYAYRFEDHCLKYHVWSYVNRKSVMGWWRVELVSLRWGRVVEPKAIAGLGLPLQLPPPPQLRVIGSSVLASTILMPTLIIPASSSGNFHAVPDYTDRRLLFFFSLFTLRLSQCLELYNANG